MTNPVCRKLPSGVNVLALTTRNQNYVLFYDDESVDLALRTIGRWAADPELSFTWFDCALLSGKIRQQEKRARSHQ